VQALGVSTSRRGRSVAEQAEDRPRRDGRNEHAGRPLIEVGGALGKLAAKAVEAERKSAAL
jgi:hypothetical protein